MVWYDKNKLFNHYFDGDTLNLLTLALLVVSVLTWQKRKISPIAQQGCLPMP